MNVNNKNASSIVLAMGLVLIMSLLVLYILEYIIPYSKNVKGIENSANAFYQSDGSIEDGLKYIKDRQIDVDNGISNLMTEKSTYFQSNNIARKYSTTSSGTIIPPAGKGNSVYNKDYNIISPNDSIQLEVGNGMVTNWSNVNFNFKIPSELNKNSYGLLGGTGAVINWQLAGKTNTLNATGSWILFNDIDSSGLNDEIFGGSDSNSLGVNYDVGIDLYGNSKDFGDFYSDNCNSSGSGCILKMFVIGNLVLDDINKTILPFLEYKIDFGTNVPLRFSRIESIGKSYGVQKRLEVRVPQETTNEAFGFTILQ